MGGRTTATEDDPSARAAGSEADPRRGKFYDVSSRYLDRSAADLRPALADGLAGEVLDLGGGTGLLFPHFERLADDDLSVSVLDPDVHYLARAATKVDDYDFDVELHRGRAESIPYDDDSFDAVVCSQVFCTVEDVPAGLAEVARVLGPDGEFRFLEHVHSDGLAGRVESVLTPLWKRVAQGCHLNRDTGSALADCGLAIVESERIDAGRLPGSTYVRGVARPPESVGTGDA